VVLHFDGRQPLPKSLTDLMEWWSMELKSPLCGQVRLGGWTESLAYTVGGLALSATTRPPLPAAPTADSATVGEFHDQGDNVEK
jgi:hypothetical protein